MRVLAIIMVLFFTQCGEKPTELRQEVTKGKYYSEEISYVRDYAESNGYNENYGVLVDFNRHSGKNRMFVVNLQTEAILGSYQGLVAHGSGCGQEEGRPKGFSNTKGSNCSSVGLSVISDRAYSNWGLHYKYWLKGLDDSNSNMESRVVVLHSWEGIPNNEVYPRAIVQSEGCFTVSNYFLSLLDGFIQTQRTNGDMLLFAFQ